MWTRAATEAQSKLLVEAYNASHKNQVELTVIPTDNYAQKIATAAGGKALPDLFAADVVFAPNYTSQASVPRHHRPDRRAAVQGQRSHRRTSRLGT